MSTQTQEKRRVNKAPNWTSYFGRAKKKIRVLYLIEFRARNKKRTCYSTLKKIAEDSKCSINTVYEAIDIAISLGILAKVKAPTVFKILPNGQPLFNNHVMLKWLSDTDKTAGETVFGEASRFFCP